MQVVQLVYRQLEERKGSAGFEVDSDYLRLAGGIDHEEARVGTANYSVGEPSRSFPATAQIEDELDCALRQQALLFVGQAYACVVPEKLNEARERRRRAVQMADHSLFIPIPQSGRGIPMVGCAVTG